MDNVYASNFCPRCGARRQGGEQYCTKCGSPMITAPMAFAPKKKMSTGVIVLIVVLVFVFLVLPLIIGTIFGLFVINNVVPEIIDEVNIEDFVDDALDGDIYFDFDDDFVPQTDDYNYATIYDMAFESDEFIASLPGLSAGKIVPGSTFIRFGDVAEVFVAENGLKTVIAEYYYIVDDDTLKLYGSLNDYYADAKAIAEYKYEDLGENYSFLRDGSVYTATASEYEFYNYDTAEKVFRLMPESANG